MNKQRPRLLFDECFGRPHIEGLKSFLDLNLHDPRAEIVHLFERFPSGTLDSIWIPEASKEGFVLISADRGKRGKGKAEKLPRLCACHGLRHVLLGSALAGEKMFDKCLAVLSVWYELLAVADTPIGTRYNLQHASRGCGTLVYRDPPKNIEPVPRPGHLF